MKFLLSVAKFLWTLVAAVIVLVGVVAILAGELGNGVTYLITGAVLFFLNKWFWNRVQVRASGGASSEIQHRGSSEEELAQLYDDCLNGNIPVIADPPILLKSRETAHFACPVEVKELKTETTSFRGYAGTRIKIGKVPIYLGGSAPKKSSREVMTPIGNAAFVVTDKRIVLSGTKTNYSIRLNQITNLELFRDAVQIMNEGRYGGRYYMMEDSRKAAIIIQGLIAQTSD